MLGDIAGAFKRNPNFFSMCPNSTTEVERSPKSTEFVARGFVHALPYQGMHSLPWDLV